MPSSFCIHYVSESGRPSSGHRTGNGQSLFQFPRRVEPKNVLTIRQLHSSPRLVSSIRFSSVAQLYLTLCNPIDCSTPGLHFHHQLLELAQTHVHQVGDAIQVAWEMSEIVQWLAHSLVLPFLGIGMRIDIFQSCGHCWVFQIC